MGLDGDNPLADVPVEFIEAWQSADPAPPMADGRLFRYAPASPGAVHGFGNVRPGAEAPEAGPEPWSSRSPTASGQAGGG
jgi:hypothetical protein